MKKLLVLSLAVTLAPAFAENNSGSVDISPGNIHEPCMTLSRGDTLAYEFHADIKTSVI